MRGCKADRVTERMVVVLGWACRDEAAHAVDLTSASVSLHADACRCVHILQLAAVLHGLMMPS